MNDNKILHHFLNANEDNFIKIVVSGKQKQEAGLLFPVQYNI